MDLPPTIEPDDRDSVRTDIVERLAATLSRPEDAEWIADSLVALAQSLYAATESVFHRPFQFVDTVCSGVRVTSPRDANLFAMLLSAIRIASQRPVSYGGMSTVTCDDRGRRDAIRSLVPQWRDAQPTIDLSAALIGYLEQTPNEGSRWIEPEVVRGLVECGGLAPSSFIDIDRLLGPDANRGLSLPADDHPRELVYWTQRLGGRVLDHLLPLVHNAPDDRVGRLAWALLDRLHWIQQTQSLCVVRRPASVRSCRAWLDELDRRAASAPRDLLLLRARLLVARDLLDRRVEALPDERRIRLAQAAQGALDGLRKQLDGGVVHDAGDTELLGRHYNEILVGLGLLGDPIRSLRAMLVVVRHIPEPVSGADLRYWHETEKGSEEQPPVRWRWFADSMVGTVHWYARVHRDDDPDLVRLREHLATFFLDRLKTKDEVTPDADSAASRSANEASSGEGAKGNGRDPNDRFIEPSPVWRRAYMRAVRELRVNPGRRGHHVLHWLARNDPHEELRREAATAYGELKQSVLLAPGVSPRRAVMAALWWIRQAQRQHLGLPVDPKGAQRTRQKESRRTKEVEEHDQTS